MNEKRGILNIPKQVKIGGHIVDVKLTNDCDEIDYSNIGKTVLAKNIIYINSNYPSSRQEEALLHELIHNCLYDLHEEQDEAMVERLGVILYAIIKDNPGIFNVDIKSSSISTTNIERASGKPAITLRGEEVRQFYRLLKNECEGASIVESTTSNLYHLVGIMLDQHDRGIV